MTALAQVEYATCIDCGGAGERGTGSVEHETGVAITDDCRHCGGDGHVDADLVSTCVHCATRFWTGDGCEHNDSTCSDCTGRCGECIADARDEAAYDVLRDLDTIGVLR